MPFYTPGPYEEYVGKLSSIRVVPKPEVWRGINEHLDFLASKRRRVFIRNVAAVAASILLMISVSLGTFYFQQHKVDQYAFSVSTNRIIQPPINNRILLTERSSFLNLPVNEQFIDEVKAYAASPTINQQSQVLPIVGRKAKPLLVNSTFPSPNQIDNHRPNHIAESPKVEAFRSKPQVKNPWGLTAYLNPLYSSHTMAARAENNTVRESGVWLWGGEIQVKRQLNKSFSLVTGVTVNPTGQNIDNLILLYGGNVKQNLSYLYANTSYGQVSLESSIAGISNIANLAKAPKDVLKSSNITTANLKQRFHHVELPLLLSARLSGGGVDFDFRLGAAVGVLVNNQFEVASSFGQYVGQTDGVKWYSAAAIGAVSIGLPLTKHINFVVEPYFRLGLLTLDHYDPNTFPFNASVRFGVGYRF